MPEPPMPVRSAQQQAIYDHFWSDLTEEEGNDPRWDPDINIVWATFFIRQCNERITAYDGNGPPP
jgi:hypothetical protein